MPLIVTVESALETRDGKGVLTGVTFRLHAVDKDSGNQTDWEYTLLPGELADDYSAILARESTRLLREIDALVSPDVHAQHKTAITVTVTPAGDVLAAIDPAIPPVPIVLHVDGGVDPLEP